jgi:putative ABC transport system substrate-binding protein
MRRRAFVLVLGGAITAVREARARQKVMSVIGFLSASSPVPFAPYVAAFRQGLGEAGYVEGRNVTTEYRWADNHYDRMPALADDLVGRKVDVIVAGGGSNGIAAAKGAPRQSRSLSLAAVTWSRPASSPVWLGRVATSRASAFSTVS